MGIGSYKEAERYRMRTNKNLTRTFYLDTRRTLDEEPFAWEQPQVASIEQPETVQGFAKGGIVSNQEKLEKLKQIVLESNSNPFKSISKNQAVLSAGYKNPSNLEARTKVRNLLDTLIPLEEKFSNHLNNVMNNLDNIPYQEIVKEGGLNKYVSKPFGVDRIAGSRKISNAYSKTEFKEARDIIRLLSNPQVFDTYGNKEMFAGEVLDNLDVKKSATRLKGGKLEDDIVNIAIRSAQAGNKNIQFLNKPGSVDASDIVFKWNGKLYGKNINEYKGKKVNNLTTDLYKLPEFNEYLESRNKLEDLKGKQVIHPVTGRETNYDQLLRETYAKGFGNDSFYKFTGLDLDHKDIKNKPFSEVRPLPRHINAAASPLNKKTFSIVKDKEKFLQEVGYNIPEESLEKSIIDFSDRVLNKKIPINKTYQSGLQSITGASKEYLTPLSKIETEGLEMEKKGAKEFVKGETQVRTSSGLRPVSEKETKIPKEFSEQKKTTVEYLTNYLNNNPEEVKAFRTAGVVCRRSVGGKVDTECLAENIIKETEKLETGTDLQKASALNKFKNATKLGAGLAEEVIGFGKGVAGRTLGPLVALNSALEQFTSGNYREGIRKIADIADLTTLVGDPLGFEKMRTEGTIEDVRGKIGKENQASLDRILEFKDKYYQLQDINTKLQRAESAAAGQYDPESPGVDPNYLNELKKQQADLNKIINSPKYQNIRTDYLNVGNAVKNEIFGRNINAPEQNKYTYETAAQEQLKSILGYDFYDELSDENKIIFKNLTASQKIKDQPVPFETPIQSPDDSMRMGFAEGGGPKMGRRGFLGLLTGIAAAPELIKSIKGTKKAAQAAKILPKVSGMPEWFNPLVTKIMKEGVDISPKAERVEDIIKVKKLEFTMPEEGTTKFRKSGSKYEKKNIETITMTEYPNGDIEIEADVFGSSFDAPFSLHYKPPKTDIHIETGEPVKYPGDFYVIEQRPKPDYGDPGGFEIDYEVMSVDDTISDLERIEKMATGKIIPLQRVEQRTGARKFVEENPSEDIVNRYGDSEIEYDRMKDEGLFDETK
jgi:hypothetical protein